MIATWGLLAALQLSATPEDCNELYGALRYRDATDACRKAIPTAGAELLPSLYRSLAMSLAALGNEEAARAAFVSLLTLEPEAELPPTTSPRLRAPLEKARQLGIHPVQLSVQADPPLRIGRKSVLKIITDDGPAHPIEKLSIRLQDAQVTLTRPPDPLTLPMNVSKEEGSLNVSVTALDRFGGKLKSSTFVLEVAPRPFYYSWKTWGIAAAALGGVGLGFGIYSTHAASEARSAQYADQAEARNLTARRTAYVADVAYGLAAAMAITSAVLFFTDPTH